MIFSLTSLLRGAAKSVRYLSLALLPALPSESGASGAPQHATPARNMPVASARHSLPYLGVIGSPALRIAESLGALPDEPRLPEPPKPVVQTPPPTVTKHEEIRTEKPVEKPPENTPPQTQPEPVREEQRGPRPVSILPDDTPRELRSEDVLPYFRYPGTSEPSRPPAPAPLPRSSATYELK